MSDPLSLRTAPDPVTGMDEKGTAAWREWLKENGHHVAEDAKVPRFLATLTAYAAARVPLQELVCDLVKVRPTDEDGECVYCGAAAPDEGFEADEHAASCVYRRALEAVNA